MTDLTADEVRIHAPELRGATEWFNVPAPLSLASLRGKVVLLDFWTYGCINCLHILPDLKRLEEAFRDELVVIGIHSAKFTNERQSENLRRIIVRYEIEHPVANDAHFAIWQAYGARAWPTQVLIDPEGYVVATASGEGHGSDFEAAIAAVIRVFDEQHKIDRRPLSLAPERARLRTSTLAFPGKVLADGVSGRLFIADSSHHRVLVATLDGHVTEVIGRGPDADGRTSGAGRTDGSFETAAFYRPQGLAFDGDRDELYIADTENHTIRAANLSTRRVSTLAGTGRQAAWGGAGGSALETSLSSPWDLALSNRLLFVAMAGTHQIWVVDLDRQLVIPYAGSGREARGDGPVDDAAFAQPSGLALGDGTLFVADAESNTVRAITLPPTNRVRTLAGGDLFEFGDVDGIGDAVRLQHPLGIAWSSGQLYLADTYNHRIKTIDPSSSEVRARVGTGQPGLVDAVGLEAALYEPGGISIASNAIYVADTNNHAIRRVTMPDLAVTVVPITVGT